MRRSGFLLFLLGMIQGFAGILADEFEAELTEIGGSGANGVVHFSINSTSTVTFELTGLAPNSVHGIHIHAGTDATSIDGSSCLGHYNPFNVGHNCPPNSERHVGDMGSVTADGYGNVEHTKYLDLLDSAPISGLCVILHELEDTCDGVSGNAGIRIAQGNIVSFESVPAPAYPPPVPDPAPVPAPLPAPGPDLVPSPVPDLVPSPVPPPEGPDCEAEIETCNEDIYCFITFGVLNSMDELTNMLLPECNLDSINTTANTLDFIMSVLPCLDRVHYQYNVCRETERAYLDVVMCSYHSPPAENDDFSLDSFCDDTGDCNIDCRYEEEDEEDGSHICYYHCYEEDEEDYSYYEEEDYYEYCRNEGLQEFFCGACYDDESDYGVCPNECDEGLAEHYEDNKMCYEDVLSILLSVCTDNYADDRDDGSYYDEETYYDDDETYDYHTYCESDFTCDDCEFCDMMDEEYDDEGYCEPCEHCVDGYFPCPSSDCNQHSDCGDHEFCDGSYCVICIQCEDSSDCPHCPEMDDLSCGGYFVDSNEGATNYIGNAAGDVFYTFEIPENSNYDPAFITCGSNFDTYLRIYNSGEYTREVCRCDDCGCCGSSATLQCELEPGNYIVQVEGYSDYEGTFVIFMACGASDIEDFKALELDIPDGGYYEDDYMSCRSDNERLYFDEFTEISRVTGVEVYECCNLCRQDADCLAFQYDYDYDEEDGGEVDSPCILASDVQSISFHYQYSTLGLGIGYGDEEEYEYNFGICGDMFFSEEERDAYLCEEYSIYFDLYGIPNCVCSDTFAELTCDEGVQLTDGICQGYDSTLCEIKITGDQFSWTGFGCALSSCDHNEIAQQLHTLPLDWELTCGDNSWNGTAFDGSFDDDDDPEESSEDDGLDEPEEDSGCVENSYSMIVLVGAAIAMHMQLVASF